VFTYEAEPESTKLLVLRESVTAKAEAVWAHRGDLDVYSGAARKDTIGTYRYPGTQVHAPFSGGK
tara:strand:- start:120 stop:314 length:195 start_codon:yes stop_codon:yes gene_type:complete